MVVVPAPITVMRPVAVTWATSGRLEENFHSPLLFDVGGCTVNGTSPNSTEGRINLPTVGSCGAPFVDTFPELSFGAVVVGATYTGSTL